MIPYFNNGVATRSAPPVRVGKLTTGLR